MVRNRPSNSSKIVGIVGAGAMGGGIAQVAASAGYYVLMFDQRIAAAENARESILQRIGRRVDQGRMSGEERDAIAQRLRPVEGLDALAPCDLIVEAIVEDLDLKRDLFASLTDLAGPETILATNTSSLPIGAISAGNANAGRIAGLHFFNPVPIMKLIEVIPGPDTRDDVVDELISFARSLGHTPVTVQDTPGFLVNFGGRAFLTEGLAILEECVATPAQIDAVMRDCWGFRMGPFELMDLTGIDVNLPVTEFIHQNTFGDPRMRSTYRHRYQSQTGRLGRKTGRGYYDYREGGDRPSPDASVVAAPAPRVVVAEEAREVVAEMIPPKTVLLDRDDGVSPIIVTPIGEDCSTFCARTGLDHRRVVALDVTGSTVKRVTLMTAPGADKAICNAIVALFTQVRQVTLIADSPGFIGQRIAAMVSNLGCEMAQQGLAGPADIDTAMRLGLNYPHGPLELAEAIGPERIYRILTVMQTLTGDDRYRPSQWLRRRVQLGLPIRQPA